MIKTMQEPAEKEVAHPSRRLRLLLKAMSVQVVKADDKAQAFEGMEEPWKKRRAKEFRAQANVLRDLLAKNRPSLKIFFGTCDPAAIASNGQQQSTEIKA